MIRIHEKLEALFSFFGTLIVCIFLLVAVLSTPNYNPNYNTVSSLGKGCGKFFFSIAFIVGGASGIPLYLSLERELTNLHEKIRKLATGFSISTCICIALVGIIPDESYIDIFLWFHGVISFYAFIGSGIYILLYSILNFIGPREEALYNLEFRGYHSALGFITFIFLLILLFTFRPIIEWILTILIIVWILITSLHLILNRFINIPITELRKLNYSTLLEIFENFVETLEKLNLKNETIYTIMQENIQLIKSRLEQEKNHQ
ncbi:MAG: DUF998 domain-containing protein [Promethearchaeota archaeon]